MQTTVEEIEKQIVAASSRRSELNRQIVGLRDQQFTQRTALARATADGNQPAASAAGDRVRELVDSIEAGTGAVELLTGEIADLETKLTAARKADTQRTYDAAVKEFEASSAAAYEALRTWYEGEGAAHLARVQAAMRAGIAADARRTNPAGRQTNFVKFYERPGVGPAQAVRHVLSEVDRFFKTGQSRNVPAPAVRESPSAAHDLMDGAPVELPAHLTRF